MTESYRFDIDASGVTRGTKVIKRDFTKIRKETRYVADSVQQLRQEFKKYGSSFDEINSGIKELNNSFTSMQQALQKQEKSVDSATKKLKWYEKVLKSVKTNAEKLRKIGSSAAGLIGSVAAGYGGSRLLNHLAKFERSMTRIDAITDVTNSRLEEARGLIRQLGETTEFSASQAAKGLELLKMGGLDLQQSMEALPKVLDLATSAQIDFSRAADIATNVMGQF